MSCRRYYEFRSIDSKQRKARVNRGPITPMQLVLNDESEIHIPLDDCLQEAWLVQCARASGSDGIEGLHARLAHCLAASLIECLDADLKPPTEAQLRFAMSIARELGIALPCEALRFRGPMAEFIGRFADSFRQKRRSYREIREL